MQRTKEFVRGFLVPFDFGTNDIWKDQSTYTINEPFADYPEPTIPTKLFVGASGETPTDTDLQIITSRSGVPTTGEFVIIDNDPLTTNTKYGANHDFILSNWSKIRSYSATYSYFKHDLLTFEDGSLLIAVERLSSVGQRRIELIKIAQNGTTTSTFINLLPAVGFQQSGVPSLCVLPDKSIMCFVCIETDENVNVNSYRSTDKGETFELVSKQVLNVAIDTDTGANGYDIQQVRVRALNGQILMLFTLYSNAGASTNKNHVMQYCSVDGGANFIKVTTADEIDGSAFHMVDLFINKNRFCAVYIGATDEVHLMVLPHGFFSMQSLRTAVKYTKINSGGSANDFASGTDSNMANGAISGWSSYEQTFNVIAKDVSDNALVGFYGENDITFYSLLTGSAPLLKPSVFYQDSTECIDEFKCASYRGGAVMVHNWTTTNIGESVGLFQLGGYSSVTYPFRDAWSPALVPIFRQNNTFIYIPIDLASRSSSLTASGSGTENLVDDYLKLFVTSSQTDQLFTRTEPRSIAVDSITVRGVLKVVSTDSGGSATPAPSIVQMETEESSGGQHSKVKIEFHEGRFEVFDISGLSPVSLLNQAFNVDQGMEFIATIYEGKFAFFYRYKSNATLQEFLTGLTNISLTTSTTGSTSQTKLIFGISGSPSAGNAESHWYQIAVSDGYGIANLSEFTQDDLIGKKFPAQHKTYIDKGVSIFSSGGTTYIGDQWQITTSSANPIENILYSVSPSARVDWRSQSATSGATVPEQRIPLQLSTNTTDFGNDIIGMHLNGINFKDCKIEYWNGASWITFQTIETSQGMKHGFVRTGRTLKQDTTNVIDQSYYFHNELKDNIAMMVNGENIEFKTIVSNTEGVFGNGLTKQSVLLLDSEPAQSSGTLFIIPKNLTICMNLNGVDASAWSITISAQKTINDDFRIALLLLGEIAISGTQYSKGRRISIEAGTITNTTPDRTMYSRAVAPDQRSVQISWSDGVDQSSFYENNPDPDFYKTSSTAGAEPTSVYQDAPYLMMGILRELQGDLKPLVYIPSISATSDTRVFNRRAEHMLSVLSSDISLESITGDELQGYSNGGEVFRVATMTLTEVI